MTTREKLRKRRIAYNGERSSGVGNCSKGGFEAAGQHGELCLAADDTASRTSEWGRSERCEAKNKGATISEISKCLMQQVCLHYCAS